MIRWSLDPDPRTPCKARDATPPMKGRIFPKFKRFIHLGLFSVFLLASLHLIHRSILIGIGEFSAPCKAQEAEVVILEGSQTVNNDAIAAGLKFLSGGKAKRLVLIIHQTLIDDQLTAPQEKYAQLLIDKSERIGLQGKISNNRSAF